MLGSDDLHYIIEDSHSPHYPFVFMKWLFWSMFALFGMFLLLSVFFLLFQRRPDPNKSA
jgi:hypothetical protein